MQNTRRKEGWVYLIKCRGKTKVGICDKDIRSRLGSYKSHNPDPVKLVELVYVKNYLQLEAYIHETFYLDTAGSWKRTNGAYEKPIRDAMLKWQEENLAVPDYKSQIVGVMF